jgi:hypothetical protein
MMIENGKKEYKKMFIQIFKKLKICVSALRRITSMNGAFRML